MNTIINAENKKLLSQLTTLKKSVNKERKIALKKRLHKDPRFSGLEYLLGFFFEMYEPHLSDIVRKLAAKGYALEPSSGFAGIYSEYQSLNGNISVDYITRNKLEKNDIKFREKDGTKSLTFFPQKADLKYITEKWLSIITILPDHSELKIPSSSPQAVEFRRKYTSQEPTLQRDQLFEKLKYRVEKKVFQSINKRLSKKANPNHIESDLGLFLEELQPQVKSAVLRLYRKGYSIDSAGFMDNSCLQMIEGDFQLEEKIMEKVRSMEVTVETNHSGYTRLQISPQSADIAKIKKQWDKIVALLPDKHHGADASMTRKARDFRIKYS